MSPLNAIRGAALITGALASVATAQVTPKVPARPVPGSPAPYSFPKIVTQTLPNGLRLAVVENHEIPVVAVRVAFAGSSSLDAPGKEGTWALMLNSLREGTTTRSARSISDAAAEIGTGIANLNFSPTGSTPGFNTARSMWLQALELVADMIVNPTFPPDAFKRTQTQIAAIVGGRPSQTAAAQRILLVELMGAENPYAKSATDSSVRGLSRDDIVAAHSAYVRPQNTLIVISGDVTVAEARAAVDKMFGSWPRGGTTVPPNTTAPTPRSTQTTIYLRDQPNAPQAQFFSGLLMPARPSPDGPAVEAVNLLLASGAISSRLSKAFRVDRGLAYSTNSNFVWRSTTQPAIWQVVFSVSPALVDTAALEWVRLVRDLNGSRPITPEELATTSTLADRLPWQAESVDAIATMVTGALLNDWPVTFYADYSKKIRALTLAEVQAAAGKYFDSSRLVIAVVGDRTKLEPALRATGIPVVIVDK